MTLIRAFLQSVSMFTVLPVPRLRWSPRADRYMLAVFPLVGIFVGGVWYSAAFLLVYLQVPEIPAAAVLTAVPFLLTGFLHLDGFMDVCDALLSCREPAARRQIRKDPHVGAFAVISFGFLLLLEFACMTSLFEKSERLLLLFLLPVFSRGLSAFFLLSFPILPDSRMGKWLRQNTALPQKAVTLGMAILSVSVSIWFGGIAGGATFLAAGTAGTLAAWHACRNFGGISGDAAGYALILCEAAGIVCLSLL